MKFQPATTLEATRLTWSKAEVCHALGVSETTFDKKRSGLEAQCGFPPKLPGFGLWSIAAVTAWVARNGGAAAELEHEDEPAAILAERRALERLYGVVS